MSEQACSVKMYTQRREELKGALSEGANFVPVIGTVKSVAEAESALDYLEVAASLIPGERIISGTLKMARKALNRGDISEASKLISSASNEIQGAKTIGEISPTRPLALPSPEFKVPSEYRLTRNADGTATVEGPRGGLYNSTGRYTADGKPVYRDNSGDMSR